MSIQAKSIQDLQIFKEPYSEDEIDYKECRFVIHIPKHSDPNKGTPLDLHMVKEILHLKDGRTVPNIRYIHNYKRPFWVTAPRFRGTRERPGYRQKREWETMDRLVQGESTQSDLAFNVAKALGDYKLASNPFQLRDSPYVYGLDIPATVSIKKEYFDAMNGKNDTPFSICYSDTETNMLGGKGLSPDDPKAKWIIMQSIFYEGRLYTVMLKDFVKTLPNPKKDLERLYEEHMPQQGKDIVKEWEIAFVDEPIDIVKAILLRCHDWKPDFLSFWNMIFDLDKMIECVEDAGYQAKDIFCDPRLPEELRYAYLKRANPAMVTASGKQKTKKPAEQWHSFLCPASFYIIDQMASYRFVRKSKQLDKEYGLDAILHKELGEKLGKLKHKPAEGLTKAEFHIFMQQKYPGEYVIYHCWDAVCMHLLTLKTKDLDYSVPSSTGFSDFMSYESEPKRYVHNFHFYILKNHDAVTGTAGKTLVQEFDEMTISTKDHIITLQPHLMVESGLHVFKDYPGLRTNFYGHGADLDVKSSYPYGQWVFNMSRQTTVRELIDIEGVREHTRRIQGLNLSGGRSNAVEFCTEIYHLPSLIELGRHYDRLHS